MPCCAAPTGKVLHSPRCTYAAAASSPRMQPDGLIRSGRSVCFVEAKHLGSASLQQRQIARTALAVVDLARERLALLVLPDEPTVPVAKHGRMPIPAALKLGLTRIVDQIAG